jgi:hypothetical protein
MPPTTGMSPLTSVSVFLGVQLKMRDAFENEGVRPENQEMFVAILTHCGSRSELVREMAK